MIICPSDHPIIHCRWRRFDCLTLLCVSFYSLWLSSSLLPTRVIPGSDPNTLSTATMFPLPTGAALRSRPRGVAGSPLTVEAEQLGAHSWVVETSICALICLTLCVQGDSLARQAAWAHQRVLVWSGLVVEAGCSGGPQEMPHLFHRAVWPLESSRSPPQVAHHVAVFPGTRLGSWRASEIGWSRIAIMDCSKKMSDLVGSHNHPWVGSTVLHESNTADLWKSRVANTGATDVGVSGSCPVHPAFLLASHVQPCHCHHHVVHWQFPPESRIIQAKYRRINALEAYFVL